MKIALLGYGKMGQTIASLIDNQRDEVVLKVTADNRASLTKAQLQQADVVIEFTHPTAVLDNIALVLEAGVPMICGTTGWQAYQPQVAQWVAEQQGAFLHASNFSIGVQLFAAINRYAARLMARVPDYQPSLTETHHIQKVDAPSGTAVSLAEDLIAQHNRLQQWQLTATHWPATETTAPEALPTAADTLAIQSIRSGQVPGTHQIRWQGSADNIQLIHEAQSRAGFALGALTAARWLVGKKGYFGMEAVLGIEQ